MGSVSHVTHVRPVAHAHRMLGTLIPGWEVSACIQQRAGGLGGGARRPMGRPLSSRLREGAELGSAPSSSVLGTGRLSGVGPGLPGHRLPNTFFSRLPSFSPGVRPPSRHRQDIHAGLGPRRRPPASVLDSTDPRVLSPPGGIELVQTPEVPQASSAPVPIVSRDAAPRAACRLSGRAEGRMRMGRRLGQTPRACAWAAPGRRCARRGPWRTPRGQRRRV